MIVVCKSNKLYKDFLKNEIAIKVFLPYFISFYLVQVTVIYLMTLICSVIKSYEGKWLE